MLCMLINFQKRNMFEDSHGKIAGTLKSHLNVVHVDLLSKNEISLKIHIVKEHEP